MPVIGVTSAVLPVKSRPMISDAARSALDTRCVYRSKNIAVVA